MFHSSPHITEHLSQPSVSIQELTCFCFLKLHLRKLITLGLVEIAIILKRSIKFVLIFNSCNLEEFETAIRWQDPSAPGRLAGTHQLPGRLGGSGHLSTCSLTTGLQSLKVQLQMVKDTLQAMILQLQPAKEARERETTASCMMTAGV